MREEGGWGLGDVWGGMFCCRCHKKKKQNYLWFYTRSARAWIDEICGSLGLMAAAGVGGVGVGVVFSGERRHRKLESEGDRGEDQ